MDFAELLSPGLRALSEAKEISNEHHCPEEQGNLRQVTFPLKSPLFFGDMEAPIWERGSRYLGGSSVSCAASDTAMFFFCFLK